MPNPTPSLDEIEHANKGRSGLEPADISAQELSALIVLVREQGRIIEKLPRTNDGVRVAPLDFVYNENGRRYVVAGLFHAERDINFGENEGHIDNSEPRVGEWPLVSIGMLYSTLASAEAANESKGTDQ